MQLARSRFEGCHLLFSIVSYSGCLVSLPLPLKVRARREDGDALVHERLAYPEVVVDPLLDAGCFAELVWFYTGSVRSPGRGAGRC